MLNTFPKIILFALISSSALAGPRVHDPSTIITCDGLYWVYSTGKGLLSRSSKDLVTWKEGPRVLQNLPPWGREIAPDQRGYYWAPDVIFLHGTYYLYYSVSAWGKQTSAIGLASNTTLNPANPDYLWVDHGVVVSSQSGSDYNAIDPSVLLDSDGKCWMAFGSFWSGIKLIELDPETGLRKTGSPLTSLAWAKEIEAPCISRHGDDYFLFVNWGLCCRGVKSTYEIRVGRSKKITGPYLDREGNAMAAGGGSLFLGTADSEIGPGHAGILRQKEAAWVSYHFYDGQKGGIPSLGLRKLLWDKDGWPVAGTHVMETHP